MKKALVILVVVLGLVMVTLALAANAKPVFKVGDEVYACNCQDCSCQTISKKEGKCPCGNDMAMYTVQQVEPRKVVLKAVDTKAVDVQVVRKKSAYPNPNLPLPEGPKPVNTRTYSTAGLFSCNCGPQCFCDTISQKPGNCRCGKEMAPVKQ